jgi:hypothetical protein
MLQVKQSYCHFEQSCRLLENRRRTNVLYTEYDGNDNIIVAGQGTRYPGEYLAHWSDFNNTSFEK